VLCYSISQQNVDPEGPLTHQNSTGLPGEFSWNFLCRRKLKNLSESGRSWHPACLRNQRCHTDTSDLRGLKRRQSRERATQEVWKKRRRSPSGARQRSAAPVTPRPHPDRRAHREALERIEGSVARKGFRGVGENSLKMPPGIGEPSADDVAVGALGEGASPLDRIGPVASPHAGRPNQGGRPAFFCPFFLSSRPRVACASRRGPCAGEPEAPARIERADAERPGPRCRLAALSGPD